MRGYHHGRLRSIASHVVAAAPPCSTSRAARLPGGDWPDPSAGAAYAAPLPLPLTSDGVPTASLAELRRRQLLAAEAEDYHAAGALKQLIVTLGKRHAAPGLPHDASVEERTAFMFEHGFVVIEDAFSGDRLHRLQTAWKRVQRPLVALWNAAKAEGLGQDGQHRFANGEDLKRHFGLDPPRLFIDVPITGTDSETNPLAEPIPGIKSFFSDALLPDGDPILLDLIDPPTLVPILRSYLGEGVKLCGVQPRTYASDRSLDPHADGYTNWHRDGSTPDGYTRPSPAHDIKVFIYFEDVQENGGCTSVVPGVTSYISKRT